MGLSSLSARAKASSPHGYQSTGLCACWRRYGLVSAISRLVYFGLPSGFRCRISMQPRRIPHRQSGAAPGGRLINCFWAPESTFILPAPPKRPASPPLPSLSPISRVDSGTVRELRLKRGEERRLAAGHLWVFSNEIDSDATPLAAFAPGDLAQITSQRGQFLGHAYVNPHALICARILSRDPALAIDRTLIGTRLRAALTLRERLYREPYYRLIFGESDGLPGLVLDRYGDVLVGQIATAGMEALKETVAQA